MRFKHRPTTVEAFQWFGDERQTEEPEWCMLAMSEGTIYFESTGSEDVQILAKTPEGIMSGKPGVWVVQGTAEEIYLIQPELFDQLYEFDADGVIDTWAGNWIVAIDAPNGLRQEHMLDRETMELIAEPGQSVANTARTLFNQLWPRRNEVNPNG